MQKKLILSQAPASMRESVERKSMNSPKAFHQKPDDTVDLAAVARKFIDN